MEREFEIVVYVKGKEVSRTRETTRGAEEMRKLFDGQKERAKREKIRVVIHLLESNRSIQLRDYN